MNDAYLIHCHKLIYHLNRLIELLSVKGDWKGERREENHKFILKKSGIVSCWEKNCRMDEVNRYIYHPCEDNVPNVNFI